MRYIILCFLIITLVLSVGCKNTKMEQQLKWAPCEVDDAAKRDECYLSVGEQKGDVRFCEKIKHESFRKECVAIIEQDPNLCKDITDASIKENCYLSIAIGEWVSCEVDDAAKRDECYLFRGEQNKDIRFCGRIGYEEFRKRCIAIIEQDPSLCEDITDNSQKELCYFSIAIATKKEFLCQKTNNQKNIQSPVKNEELISQKDYCYLIISFNTKNKELCEKIGDKGVMGMCKSRLT